MDHDISGSAESTKPQLADSSLSNYSAEMFMDVSPDLMSVISADGHFLHVNPAWEQVLGYSTRELESKPVSNYLFPEDIAKTRIEFEKALKDKVVFSFVNRFLCRDGSIRWFDWKGKASSDHQTIYAVTRDITKSERIKEILSQQASILKTVTDSARDAIIIMDDQGCISFWNNAASSMFGYSAEEVVGKNLHYLLAPQQFHEEFSKAFHIYKSTGTGAAIGKSLELQAIRKGGEVFPFELSLSSVRIKDSWHALGFLHDITQRKKTEGVLREKEKQYRSLFENLTLVFILYEVLADENGEIRDLKLLEHNDRFPAFTGIHEGELKGKTYLELFPSADQKLLRKYGEVALTGNPFLLEYYSEFFTKHLRVQAYSPQKGQVAIIIEDISERKTSERLIKESEAKFRAIFENLTDVYIQTRFDGMIMEVSPSVKKVFQFTREELIGESSLLLYANPSSRDLLYKEIKEHGEVVNLELLMKRKDGTQFWISINIHFFLGADGKKAGLAGMLRDITPAKEAEKVLKESESLFRGAFELPLVGAAITSPQKGWVKVNDTLLDLLGYSWEELSTMTWAELTHPEDMDADTKQFDRVVSGEIDHYALEKRFIAKNGKIIWSLLSVACVRKSDQSVDYMIAFIKDISMRKKYEIDLIQSEEKFRKLNATKDKFFSIISHDLRSPFQGFLGTLQTLDEDVDYLNKAQFQKLITFARHSAENLYGLLVNLLEWSKVQTDSVDFNPEPFLMGQALKTDLEVIQATAAQKDITLSIGISDDLKVFADKAMIATAIRNLLSNAIKFTPRGGDISISTTRSGDSMVLISVRDNGIGIPQKMIGNLFRIDVATARKGTEGEATSGLGLILVKEFTEKNGGKIWVESEEGKGSVFNLTLPRRNDMQEEEPSIEKKANWEGFDTKEKIVALIVEDDSASRFLLSIYLKKYANKVFDAISGKEALELYRNNPQINLILMDIQLPGMDGYVTTREMRKLQSKAIIIAQTAKVTHGSRQEAIDAGCDEFIEKPISLEYLESVIGKYFNKG